MGIRTASRQGRGFVLFLNPCQQTADSSTTNIVVFGMTRFVMKARKKRPLAGPLERCLALGNLERELRLQLNQSWGSVRAQSRSVVAGRRADSLNDASEA